MSDVKIYRIDFSADEWLAGTFELSDADRGVYITICSLIWSRGARITEELLRRHSRSHGNALSASLARLEKAGKIVRNGLEIGQKRAEKELEHARKRSAIGRENVAKRWKDNDVDGESVLLGGKANYQLSTINYQKNPPKPPLGAKARERRAAFDEWWRAYPHKVGKAAAAKSYERALARASPAELLDGVSRYIANKPPDRAWCNPATWLNGDRWLDQPALPIANSTGRYDPLERSIQSKIAKAKKLRDAGDPNWSFMPDPDIEEEIRKELGP
jgi:uncharacterized protein YdaU (DUF1376 family)